MTSPLTTPAKVAERAERLMANMSVEGGVRAQSPLSLQTPGDEPQRKRSRSFAESNFTDTGTHSFAETSTSARSLETSTSRILGDGARSDTRARDQLWQSRLRRMQTERDTRIIALERSLLEAQSENRTRAKRESELARQLEKAERDKAGLVAKVNADRTQETQEQQNSAQIHADLTAKIRTQAEDIDDLETSLTDATALVRKTKHLLRLSEGNVAEEKKIAESWHENYDRIAKENAQLHAHIKELLAVPVQTKRDDDPDSRRAQEIRNKAYAGLERRVHTLEAQEKRCSEILQEYAHLKENARSVASLQERLNEASTRALELEVKVMQLTEEKSQWAMYLSADQSAATPADLAKSMSVYRAKAHALEQSVAARAALVEQMDETLRGSEERRAALVARASDAERRMRDALFEKTQMSLALDLANKKIGLLSSSLDLYDAIEARALSKDASVLESHRKDLVAQLDDALARVGEEARRKWNETFASEQPVPDEKVPVLGEFLRTQDALYAELAEAREANLRLVNGQRVKRD